MDFGRLWKGGDQWFCGTGSGREASIEELLCAICGRTSVHGWPPILDTGTAATMLEVVADGPGGRTSATND